MSVVPTQTERTHWNFWWGPFFENVTVNLNATKTGFGYTWGLVVILKLISNSEWFLFPLTLSYNMLWTWRTYHETLPYSIYWNVVSGGIWWRRRDGVWRRRNPEIRNWDELCETKRNVLNMKFYFWLTFIASDHLASGQGGRYRPLLNRAYQNLQREAAKPPPPPPPHNPNYRHGNSYTHNTARKLLFYRPVIWLSISPRNGTSSWEWDRNKVTFDVLTSWPQFDPFIWFRMGSNRCKHKMSAGDLEIRRHTFYQRIYFCRLHNFHEAI